MPERNKIKILSENIEKVLVGKSQVIEFSFVALLAGGHILLEDVPGVGKTTLANTIAKSIAGGFTRIQFTPDTLPSDITGLSIYNMQTGSFQYVKGAIMNHIILADEINRTSPKTQASLLEAMEEGQISVDGTIYPLPKPFMVIATQNPIDYLGTYSLPEAQLDRFLLKLSIGYPDTEYEKSLVDHFLHNKDWKKIEAVVDTSDILMMQEEVSKVKVHKDLVTYVVEIVEQTRNHSGISLGASPRGTLGLIRASQALAYIRERDYLIPDDIRTMVLPVLTHRLVLSAEAKLNKQSAEQILAGILRKVKIPIL